MQFFNLLEPVKEQAPKKEENGDVIYLLGYFPLGRNNKEHVYIAYSWDEDIQTYKVQEDDQGKYFEHAKWNVKVYLTEFK